MEIKRTSTRSDPVRSFPTFLLVPREDESFREKTRFPLVNQSFFEMKRAVLKSMIS